MLPLSLPPPCVCARVPRCALAPSSSKASGPPRSACPWRPALSNREHPPVTPERRDLPERCLAFARATWLLHAQRSNPLVWCLSWVTSINEKARVKRDCRLAVSYCRSIRACAQIQGPLVGLFVFGTPCCSAFWCAIARLVLASISVSWNDVAFLRCVS